MLPKHNLTIVQGKTFSKTLRWETGPIVYKDITAITKDAPVQITAPAHGLVDGQRVAIVSVQGMTQINAKSIPPAETDYHKVTVVDINTITLNDVNSSQYSTYKSGGFVQYNTAVNLTGMTARMKIKDRVGGTTLASLTTADGSIVVDPAAKTITLNMSATTTAAFDWQRGVYDLEVISGSVVSLLLTGAVKVYPEVTT